MMIVAVAAILLSAANGFVPPAAFVHQKSLQMSTNQEVVESDPGPPMDAIIGPMVNMKGNDWKPTEGVMHVSMLFRISSNFLAESLIVLCHILLFIAQAHRRW